MPDDSTETTSSPPTLAYHAEVPAESSRRLERAASLLRTTSAFVMVEGMTLGGINLANAIQNWKPHALTASLVHLLVGISALCLPILVGFASLLTAPWVEERSAKAAGFANALLYVQLTMLAVLCTYIAIVWINIGRLHAAPVIFILITFFQASAAIRALILLNTSRPEPAGKFSESLLFVARKVQEFNYTDLDDIERLLQKDRTRHSWRCTPLSRTVIALFLLPCSILLLSVIRPDLRNPDTCSTISTALFLLLALLCLRTLWRGGCTLDKSHRELTRWRGILVRLLPKRIPFSNIQSLHLARGKHPRNRNQNWCHLALTVNHKRILLRTFDYRPQAQRVAHLLATTLSTQFYDET